MYRSKHCEYNNEEENDQNALRDKSYPSIISEMQANDNFMFYPDCFSTV